MLKGFFERMAEAADILDLDTMEEIGDEMKQYRYEEEDKERLERLLEAIESIDTDACCEIIKQWEAEL